MAIPTPRSFNQILSEMLDAFLARFGIDKVKPGSPILSILEAAAQSDLRSTHDIFSYLNSINLDRAEGDAVDKIGADEDLPRLGQTFGTGAVTITDGSFDKITTKLYVGSPAPIVGSLTLFVADGSAFPAAGSLYIGRGTVNYEGPLLYTAIALAGSAWEITLDPINPTQKFHNLQEPVVLAQGGNRLIPAGTIARTAQSNVNEAVEFSTMYSVVIPDGETKVTGVTVAAQEPGTIGRINAGAIVEFSSPPFAGATVTNPLPFSNARAVESQTSYKERIRTARQTRPKGTPLAITSGVLGVLAPDENKTVLSASFVRRQGFPGVLYVDDGTGYEERSTGVSIESLVDSATGGEQYFEVNHRPVAKAFLETTISEPFTLVAGATLSVVIAGITYKHTFSADNFRNIANASAYEVVASINSDPGVPFNARLSGNGDLVSIMAEADTGESLEVVAADDDEIDANEWLGFTVGQVDTMLLYKNDRLLSKDGRTAALTSNPQASWAALLTTPATVELAIDNTPAATYSFTSQDFIDQGYSTMSALVGLDAWVAVFNARLPGVTATKSGAAILFESNLGPANRGRLRITGGTLVTDGVLVVGDSEAEANDFTLDRNTGQLRLETVLAAGDKLSIGTANTRAFVESTSIPTTNILSNAESWWVVDGQAEVIRTGIAAGTGVSLAAFVPSAGSPWGDRVRVTSGTLFSDVVVGDWAIFNDSGLNVANRGAFRVAYVDPAGAYFDIERPTLTFVVEAPALVSGGLVFVRTTQPVQRVVIPTANNYTAASFATSINTQLRGATAYVSRTTKLRVRTNTFGATGDIALVAQDVESAKMLMQAGSAVENLTSHLGSREAASSETGTPEFVTAFINTVTNPTTFERTATSPLATAGHQLAWVKPYEDDDAPAVDKARWAGYNQHTSIYSLSGTTIVVRNSLERTPGERFYAASPYAIGPEDDFTVVIDEDQQQQRYVMPMYRNVVAQSATYGASNDLGDVDNSGLSLAAGFGIGFDWLDYAVWMKARVKTHDEAGDTTKTVLYRYNRFGPEGNQVYVRYVYPAAASSAIGVTWDNSTDGQTWVNVAIPSGAARTGVTVRNSTKVGTIVEAGPGVIKTLTYILGFAISTADKVVRLKVKPPRVNSAMIAGDAITGASSGATAVVVSSEYSTGTTGYGYLTINTIVGTFQDGETINSPTAPGAHSAVVDGTQYALVTATLDVATPGATDHGFFSDLISTFPTTNFAVGDVVVGATSGAKAVVTAIGVAYLQVREMSGTFIAGEAMSATVFGAGAGNVITTTRGDTVYVNSSSGSFATGSVNIVGRSLTTIQYIEGVAAVAATPNIGTVSNDVGEATTTGSTAIVGDLVNINSDAGQPSGFERTIRTTTLAAQYWKGPADGTYTNSTVVWWNPLVAATNLSFFPVATASSTAADYETAVNALNTIVTAKAIGALGITTGIISQASFDEFNATLDKHYTLVDGINWIRSQVNPPDTATDYNFTFKAAIAAGLTGAASDWANEEIRLVPTTTKNVVDWFNAQAVSGLSSVAETAVSQNGNRPQIASLLAGRDGSVHIQGGTANSLSIAVEGSAASIASTYAQVSVQSSDAAGLSGGQWVAVQNYATLPKTTFTTATVMGSITALGVFTLHATSPTNIWNFANTVAPALVDGETWQIERQGDFVSYQRIGALPMAAMEGVLEGDWVIVGGSVTSLVNSRNRGQFRIVRANHLTGTFWIENSNVLEEVAVANVHFLTYNSILPGDQIHINSDLFGANTEGVWTVATIDRTNSKTCTLSVTSQAPDAWTGPQAMGAYGHVLLAVEGTPTRMIKKIRGIALNSSDSDFTDVKFETVAGYRQISEAAGSLLQSLDKLDFSTSLIQGVDGYRYSTGLIREVNRVAYGDPSDSASYPGIIAAGAQVNIEGPLVKRVTCSLALRLKTGVGENDIKVRVRSAVASAINEVDVGEAISISKLIDAAGSVPGVVAVTWLAPVYGAGNDLIPVQPFEKPLVLDLTQDIRISLVSE